MKIVIPNLIDQFYWGQGIFELGVGPQAIPRPKLNSQNLAVALKELTSNERIRTAAAKIGEHIRSENGIENAVHLIEETFVN